MRGAANDIFPFRSNAISKTKNFVFLFSFNPSRFCVIYARKPMDINWLQCIWESNVDVFYTVDLLLQCWNAIIFMEYDKKCKNYPEKPEVRRKQKQTNKKLVKIQWNLWFYEVKHSSMQISAFYLGETASHAYCNSSKTSRIVSNMFYLSYSCCCCCHFYYLKRKSFHLNDWIRAANTFPVSFWSADRKFFLVLNRKKNKYFSICHLPISYYIFHKSCR